MVARRGYILVVIILAFTATGCFRQASEPLDALEQQSVANTASAPNTTLPTESMEESPTVESVDTTPEPNVEPTNTPIIAVTESTAIPSPTSAPTDIPLPTEDTSANTTDTTPVVEPTRITPLPPGNSAVDTPTPAPVEPQATNTPSGLVTPTTAPEEVVDECVYIVQPGDNLFRIAINNGTNLESLQAANPQLSGDLIQPGDRIIIPNCVPEDAEIPDGGGDTQAEAPTGGSTGIVHVVQAGETLSTIAQTYGVTMTSISQANNLTNPDQLSVGQELVIPQ